jgi:hypothetical protein
MAAGPLVTVALAVAIDLVVSSLLVRGWLILVGQERVLEDVL